MDTIDSYFKDSDWKIHTAIQSNNIRELQRILREEPERVEREPRPEQLTQRAWDNCTAVYNLTYLAVYSGSLKTLQFLISHGANVNLSIYGRTPLQQLLYKYTLPVHEPYMHRFIPDDKEIVVALVAAGANMSDEEVGLISKIFGADLIPRLQEIAKNKRSQAMRAWKNMRSGSITSNKKGGRRATRRLRRGIRN